MSFGWTNNNIDQWSNNNESQWYPYDEVAIPDPLLSFISRSRKFMFTSTNLEHIYESNSRKHEYTSSNNNWSFESSDDKDKFST